MAKRRRRSRVKVNKKAMDIILILGVLTIISVLFILILLQKENSDKKVTTTVKDTVIPIRLREPAVSGQFYPSDDSELRQSIEKYLDSVSVDDIHGIRGLVSPHAGYVYSGLTAAHGYKLLSESRYDTVIVLGPSHHHYFDKVSIPDITHYKTPLGLVKLSDKVNALLSESLFINEPKAHLREHSVEVQIPFLQSVLGSFELIPIVVGDVDPRELADILKKYVDDDTLVVASTDLSHYHSYADAIDLDKICTESISSIDFDMMYRCEACGKIPTLTLMHLADNLLWKSNLLDYRNSGDTSGVKNRGVVGYTSIAFYDGLDDFEQSFLIDLVADTLSSHYMDGTKPVVDESELTMRLREERACFVTLRMNHDLRGCIGHLSARMPLYKCIIENSLNAALNDRRFNPVTVSELDNLELEISVLSEPRLLRYNGPDELLDKLIPGIDGVVIKYGGRQSTYLPVVWDQLPKKEDFLSRLCVKGGSQSDCWMENDVEVYTYQAQEFS